MVRERDWVRETAEALTDLNIFAAVVVLLESSLQTVRCDRSAQRIISIAKAEQQRCLRRYDDARANANRK